MGIFVIFSTIFFSGCTNSGDILEASNMSSPDYYIESKRELSFSKSNSSVKNYFIYVDGKLTQVFQAYKEALEFAENSSGKIHIQNEYKDVLWDNYSNYKVILKSTESEDEIFFEELSTAIKFAKESGTNEVVLKKDSQKIVWSGKYEPKHIIKNVKHITQLPELPRGCEVTSLTMLLNTIGISADKMILAEQIKKDPTPYKRSKGITYFGNPHDGFVGDIYSLKNQGLGVYNEPVFELAQKYTESAINLTGLELDDILYYVSIDIPVWIITNSRYTILPESEFRTWNTPSGEIKITYREHSVIITGYDDKYIYFNDPLSSNPQSRVERESFTGAYNQMGKQSIGCLPKFLEAV